jgi:hypothetical protein
MNYETGVSLDGSRDMESESESEKEAVAQEQSSALVAVAPVRMALEVAPSRKKQYVDVMIAGSCVLQMHPLKPTYPHVSFQICRVHAMGTGSCREWACKGLPLVLLLLC